MVESVKADSMTAILDAFDSARRTGQVLSQQEERSADIVAVQYVQNARRQVTRRAVVKGEIERGLITAVDSPDEIGVNIPGQ
jgi:hypothetical protein